ncbi:TRAP transporter large permease [Magnetospira sp. QH-2]|uniref:TRAP transporter large permease n=1 Tax=Magnetospira sp. (strain QH-2) TaxID=1288970 RepID=UPI0003E813E5|nr:TRAP transporter large permease subunit [Magnetospira sp. QH-2]CCQ73260.1 Putative TRAP-type C4-dicarboxylate transport system, large permease component (dctM subunit) [Magnetospira sp. QH-2]
MTIGFLFITLFGLILIGTPIAFALGLSSVLTLLFFGNDDLGTLSGRIFDTMHHYTLMAIPFFVLSSAFLSTGGVARRLIRFAINVVGHMRGGLAMSSVLACMLFAAVSGSSPATVAAIGSIVIAGMIKSGYPKPFAAGVIANAGTLGILIPPSIVMVVYAAATEVSVGRMFLAGVFPGLLAGVMLMIAIYIRARVTGLPKQPVPSFEEFWDSFKDAIWGLMLIVVILGGIYGGIFTPTEAAAVAAVYAYIIAIFVYRDLGPLKKGEPRPSAISLLIQVFTHKEITHTILDAAKITIMLLFIISNAMLFAFVLTTERIPHEITEMIIAAGFEWWSFLIIVNLLLLAAGNFMEPSAILLIMAPILFPIAMELGIDPIHLGIIMVVNMEIGMITPPVGLNLFVTAGITNQSILWVVKAALPWLMILLVFLVMVTYIPAISTWLPTQLMGPEIITD